MSSNQVVSLLRLSTAEQAADDRSGLERQRTINLQTAKARGLTVRREIQAVDVSGRHVQDDPQFRSLFAELATDPTLTGILVSEQSRLFRPEYFSDYSILDVFAKHKKLIFLPGEVIDAGSDSGIVSLTLNGLMSGQELRKIRERSISGKKILRDRGANPSGNQCVPKTVRYVRTRNSNGKVIEGHWELVPLEVERVKKAFQLLFEGQSYDSIAEQVGGGWSGHGMHRLLMNPVHIGIRRYSYAPGPEYKPKPTAKNPNPKPRRKQQFLDVPVDVPTFPELIAGIKPPTVPPIMSIEEWDRAQAIMNDRITGWKKSKLKNATRPRFLVNQGFCSCGQPLYGHYGSNGRKGQARPHQDAYICRSKYKAFKGKDGACGGPWSIRRTDLEACVADLVRSLADAKFLTGVLKQVLAADQAKPDPAQKQREQALAKFEAGRKELLGMVRSGDITRAEFRAEVEVLEREKKAVESLAPVQRPPLDPKLIVEALVEVFQGFDLLPFGRQRAILHGAIKRVIVDGQERSIRSVTISGGYLGRGVNSQLPRSQQLGINAPQDLVIEFPQPIQIPYTCATTRKRSAA